MANTLNLGNGNWAVKKDSLLAYNSENNNYKPLPFDFTRASSATVVNKAGLIEVVGSGEPRIDFSNDAKGALLLEPSRSNLFSYSEDFSTWSRSGWTLTSGLLAPNGSLDAYSVLRTTGSTFAQSTTLLSNTTYTFSVYIKNVNATNIQLRVQNQAGNTSGTESNCIVFSVTNQTNDSDFTRITHTFNTGDAGTYGLFLGYYSAGEHIVYGAQLEEGSYPTSYIPTSGSAVTRSQDGCLQGGFQDKNIFGSNQGTAVFDIKWDEINYIFDFNVGGVEAIRIYNDNNTQWRIRDTTTSTWYFTGFNITQGQRTKIGFKWSGTEIVAFQNGVKSSTSGLIGSNTSVESITTNKLNNTSNIQFYNTALTDNELQQLTS